MTNGGRGVILLYPAWGCGTKAALSGTSLFQIQSVTCDFQRLELLSVLRPYRDRTKSRPDEGVFESQDGSQSASSYCLRRYGW